MVYPGALPMHAMYICYVFIRRADEMYVTQPINNLCTRHYCVAKSFTNVLIYHIYLFCIKLINNSLSLNKGNHDCDGV